MKNMILMLLILGTKATFADRLITSRSCMEVHTPQKYFRPIINLRDETESGRRLPFQRYFQSSPIDVAFDLIGSFDARKIPPAQLAGVPHFLTPVKMQFDDKVTFEVFFEADWHGNSDLNKILSDLGVVAGDFDSAGRRQYEHRAWWRQKSQSTEVVLRTTSYGLLVLATQQRMRVNNIRFADDVSYSRIKWIKELCVQGNEQCLETDRDSKRASEKVLTRERLRLLNLDLFGQGMKGPVKRMLANTMTSIGRYKLSFTRGLVDDEETIALIESVIKDRLTFVRGRATPISCNITIADAFFLASLRNVSMVEDFATYSDINRRIVGILD